MARRRHRKTSTHGWRKWVTPSVFAASFIGQLAVKDFQPGTTQASFFQSGTGIQRAQMLANIITGRISGINIFSGAPQFQQTVNPAGMINKYVGLGLLMSFIYPKLPEVPQKALIKKAGGALIAGGLFGGFFDPATGVRGGATASGVARVGNLGAIGAPAGTTVMGTIGTAQPASRVSGFGGTFSY